MDVSDLLDAVHNGTLTREEADAIYDERRRQRGGPGVEVTPRAAIGMASILIGMLWVGAPLSLLRLALPIAPVPVSK